MSLNIFHTLANKGRQYSVWMYRNWKKILHIQKKKKKKKSASASSVRSILATDSDWPFPGTYYKSIGSTMSGFWFFYPNLSTTLKNLIQPTLILSFLQSCISFHLWLVCLSHIWHASKQMSSWFRLCSMNSVLSSRSWLVWFLRKMPLTMHDQLLACWMIHGCKFQKISLNLVWLTLEQERKLFLPLRRLLLKKWDSFDTTANKLSSKSS